MSRIDVPLDKATEREPLTRGSKSRHQRLVDGRGSLRYHAMANKLGWWYWCGCLPAIRGITDHPVNTLGPKMRKYKQWAGR